MEIIAVPPVRCVMREEVCERRDGMRTSGQTAAVGWETVGTDGNKTPFGGMIDGGNK